MQTFFLTAFDKTGEKLLDERFEAATEQEAKMKGEKILSEQQLLENTYRCGTPAGKLILFHR